MNEEDNNNVISNAIYKKFIIKIKTTLSLLENFYKKAVAGEKLDEIEMLYEQVNNLSGSAKIFNFSHLGDLSRILEEALKEAIQKKNQKKTDL